MAKLGKRLRKVYEGIDREAELSLTDAVKEVKSNATAKFDETVDIALNLNIDSHKADQSIRGMVQLPSGTGKTVRVAVFAKDAKAEEAKKAGADIVGADDLFETVQKGTMDFDRCIASPDMMGLVGRLGKVLGPKGMMPNPKLGTVTEDVGQAVKDAKAGQVEFRADKAGTIHAGVGKASFAHDALVENIKAFTNAVAKSRPNGIKGSFVKKACLGSTMGPSFKVALQDLSGTKK